MRRRGRDARFSQHDSVVISNSEKGRYKFARPFTHDRKCCFLDVGRCMALIVKLIAKSCSNRCALITIAEKATTLSFQGATQFAGLIIEMSYE